MNDETLSVDVPNSSSLSDCEIGDVVTLAIASDPRPIEWEVVEVVRRKSGVVGFGLKEIKRPS